MKHQDNCQHLPPRRSELQVLTLNAASVWQVNHLLSTPLPMTPDWLPEFRRVSKHLNTIRSTSKDYPSGSQVLKLLVNSICEISWVEGNKDSYSSELCTGSHPTCWIHCYIIQGLMNKINHCSFSTRYNTAISGSRFELKTTTLTQTFVNWVIRIWGTYLFQLCSD